MQEYRVELDAYAGPLDLLLYLVKRHEIDLNDIPIAQLTEQYLAHLELLRELHPDLDMEQVGEFLVMAATLLEIKSQMLTPRPEEQGESEEGEAPESSIDPRFELVQQLLAYKRYKDAARALEHRQAQWASRFPAQPGKRPQAKRGEGDEVEAGEDEDAPPREIELDDVNVLDLCEAFSRILDSIGQTKHHQVTYDDTPISLHAADIYDRLLREGPMTLQKMFEGRGNRSELIGLFLATLELVRDKRVRVLQEQIGGEITLEAAPEGEAGPDVKDDSAADWRNPKTGEVEYDWPDDEARKRAERRARMREKRAAGGEYAASDEELEELLEIEEQEKQQADVADDVDEDEEPFGEDD